MKRVTSTSLIKGISLGVLVVAAWPLPAMLSHNSPDGNILGLYDTAYFLLMIGYLSIVIGWGAVTLWAVARLNEARLTRLRAYFATRPVLFSVVFGLFFAGMLVLRLLINNQIIGLPNELFRTLKTLPVIVAGLSYLLIGVVLADSGSHSGKWLEDHPVFAALYRWRYEVSLGIIIALFIVVTVYMEGLFVHPLNKDSGAHMYIGQRLLAGGIPYRDILYFHPPMRFVVSGLWAAVTRLSGLPPVETARVLNLILVIPWLIATYHITRTLSGARLAGLLAVLLMVQTEILFKGFARGGPNMKVEIALAIIASVWAAQHKRWIWAGVLSACAAMMWLPAGISTAGLLVAAFLDEKPLNWQAAIRLGLGAGAVVAALTGALVATGTLEAAFRQTVLAAFSVTGSLAGSQGVGILNIKRLSFELGGWLLTSLVGFGIGYLVLHQFRKQWRLPATTAFVLGTVPLVIVMMFMDVLNPGDQVVLLVAVAVSGGVGTFWLLEHGLPEKWFSFHWAVVLVLGLLLVETGSQVFRDFEKLPTDNTLSQQRSMATAIDQVLGDDDRVQCFDEQWLVVMTQRQNVLPVIQIRPKGMVSNTLAGWDADRIVQTLERAQPVFVLVSDGPDLTVKAYLNEQFVLISQTGQYSAYARPGYEGIEELRANLAEN